MHYLDTSALAKLVITEPESAPLRTWLLAGDRGAVSSDLARTELVRSVRRIGADHLVATRAVLDSIVIITLSAATYETAGRLDPVHVRSLDALHLAVALELGDDLHGIVTYDVRQAEAARANGLAVLAPS